MVRFREVLERLEPYRPGKLAEVVARAYGLQEVVKLASNENPYPPLPSVQEAIARAAGEVNRYPDDESTDLRDALARRLEVEPDRITVGCGSIDVCYQAFLAAVDPGGDVLLGWPTFNAYPLLGDLAGAVLRTVPLRDGRYDLAAIADRVEERTRLIVVCNPNNPTGTAVTGAEMKEFLNRVPEGLLVVVDEAYQEFVDDPDFPDSLACVRDHDNLLVLRSFSKAHGLAGLRVGYGISSPEVIAALRKVHMPFGVGRLGQVAALASLQAAEELQSRVAEVIAERSRIREALVALGHPVWPTQANFVLLPAPGRAQELGEACEARGVVVRPVGPDAVRVTIGTPRENDRFLAVAAEVAEPAA